ncbi:MAG: PDZ domain-containing protein [Chthoniobacterales bacterium]
MPRHFPFHISHFAFRIFLIAFVALRATAADEPSKDVASLPTAASVVRVNSTNQAWNFDRPWLKRPPFTRRGIGVVIEGGRVLVTAETIANHTYVELERPGNSEKIPAVIERVDYESNLALLKPQDPKFLDGTVPVSLAKSVQVGAKLNVLQLETTGAAAFTPATVTTVTVGGYPADGIALLIYRVSAPLQYRDNSFTVPVFHGDKLAGLLMRYDSRSQSADLVPEGVISNFLARADKQPYNGISRAGITFSPTRDPQFRRYLGMKKDQTGIYVVSIAHGGSAEKAGLKQGDVVLRVNGYDIDEDGNYPNPDYGKIPFSHLISTARLPGGEILLRVLRDGKVVDLQLPLEPRDPSKIISEPYVLDHAPRYYILGGLVFQELSRAYLREWGSDWKTDAPARLIYLDEFQDELPADRGRIVFLNDILPADTSVGYDDVDQVVVQKINGRVIKSLDDVAEAVKHPVNGFHKIELESDPGVLYLDAKQTADTAEELRKSYDLPALDNLNDPETKVAP